MASKPKSKPDDDATRRTIKAAAAGFAAGAAGAAVVGADKFGIAVGGGAGAIKAVTKLNAEDLLDFVSDSPSTRRLRTAVATEMINELLEEHGEAVEEAADRIPEEQRASELASVFSAASKGWRTSAGPKKRRVLLAVLVNGLQPDALEAGDALQILGIVGKLDYAELCFLKHEFSDAGPLKGAKEVIKGPAQDRINGRRKLQERVAAGTEGGYRVQRLKENSLVQLYGGEVFQLERTWLGNWVLAYCGSDAFREDTVDIDVG